MSREPSMEEILSSIRRVIARDDAPQGSDLARKLTPMADPVPQSHSGAGGFDEDEDDDILELTEAEPAAPESMDQETMIAPTPVPDPAPPSVPTESEPTQAASPQLVSRVSAAASRQSLDALAAALAVEKAAEPASPTPASDLSVNALVEAALRPMLKNWLDAHLPEMVERLVAREISRITGSRL